MQTNTHEQAPVYMVGLGLSAGTVIGMFLGLLFFHRLVLGSAMGAVLGLLIGAAIDNVKGVYSTRTEPDPSAAICLTERNAEPVLE